MRIDRMNSNSIKSRDAKFNFFFAEITESASTQNQQRSHTLLSQRLQIDQIFEQAFPEYLPLNSTKNGTASNRTEDDLLSTSSEFSCYKRLVRNYHRECSDNLNVLSMNKKAQQRMDEYGFQYFYIFAKQCKRTYEDGNIAEQTI